MSRLINTYILKEIFAPFILATCILTMTVLLSKALKLVELVIMDGVGPGLVFRFILSMLPSFLIYILPIAFLIGVIVACARLSSDSELIAMKSAGLSLFTILKPVAFFAVLVYVASLLVSIYLYPWGNINSQNILFDVARNSAVAGIEEKRFYARFNKVVLYVDSVPDKKGDPLKGVFISQMDKEQGTSSVIFAKKGYFTPPSNPTNGQFTVSLILTDGTIHSSTEGQEGYHMVNFGKYTVSLVLGGRRKAGLLQKSDRVLYTDGLKEKIELMKAKGIPAEKYILILHKRFAMPAAVFIFAIIGIPLGIQKVRSARLTGFSVAIGVVLIYYIFLKGLEGLGSNGTLNPVFAAWATNAIFGAVGLHFFYQSAKDRPIGFLVWIETILSRLTKRLQDKFLHEKSLRS